MAVYVVTSYKAGLLGISSQKSPETGFIVPSGTSNTVLAGTQDTYSTSKTVLTEHKGVSDVFLTTRLVASY